MLKISFKPRRMGLVLTYSESSGTGSLEDGTWRWMILMGFFALEQVGTTPGHVLSNYCPVPDDSKSVKTSPVLLGPWRTGHGGG